MITSIQKLQSPQMGLSDNNKVFKKILYAIFLDTLSHTTDYEDKSNNKGRYVYLLNKFCSWEHSTKISLPQLLLYLENNNSNDYREIKNFIYERIEKWKHKIIDIEFDPTINDMNKMFENEITKNKKSFTLENFSHAYLFYNYRNKLVHEFREPGHPVEFGDHTEPYYIELTKSNSINGSWELAYPVKFFEQICTSALENLKNYYYEKEINPYSSFKFGSSFRNI